VRYYELTLYQPDDKALTKPYCTWTSHPNGQFDPCALGISFDAMVYPMDTPAGGTPVTLTGIALDELKQSTQLGMHIDSAGKVQPGMLCVLKAGMGKGLPLVNPAQQGVLLKGTIWQCFGNWEGTSMTLDFVIYCAAFTTNQPGNLVLNWKAGMKLSDALQACLKVAYPDSKLDINISPQLVQSADDPHFSGTLEQLSSHVRDMTKGKFLGDNYPGVSIVAQPGKISVFDATNTGSAQPTQINFTDLIGQPTWISLGTMQMKLVLRGDLQVGTFITMPKSMSSVAGQVQTTSNSWLGNINADVTFQGTFMITKLRHIGDSRSPDGAAWCTVIDCIATDLTAGTASSTTGQGNGS